MARDLVQEIYENEFKLVKGVILFHKFGDSAIVHILVNMEPMEYHGPRFEGGAGPNPEQGEMIVKEGKTSSDIFVVISGCCFASSADVDGGKPSVMFPGDYFGERSALSLGKGGDGRESSRTVWARGTHPVHAEIHKGSGGAVLPWPVVGRLNPQTITDENKTGTGWTAGPVSTSEWTKADYEGAKGVSASMTHVRILSSAALAGM